MSGARGDLPRGGASQGQSFRRLEWLPTDPATWDVKLLDDEMMEPVLRSAGVDSRGFREMIAEAARRSDYFGAPDGKIHEC